MDEIIHAIGTAANAPDVSCDNAGYTPLHWAVWHGRADALIPLLEAGADINAGEANGFTPLHLAAQLGEAEIVRTLIDNGADITAIGGIDDLMPLHMAAGGNGGGSVEAIEALLEAKADIEARDKCGRTALHWAVSGLATDKAEVLLDAGANIEAHDHQKATALHYAGRRGGPVKMLVVAGANIDALNRDGNTPLAEAEENGNKDGASVLREALSRRSTERGLLL